MKSLEKTASSPLPIQKRSDFAFVRTVVIAALAAVDNARQQCVIAGYLLMEAKAAMPHGDFENWVGENIPEITIRTAQTWMRAAASVAKALDFPPAIEIEATVIPLSKLLSAPIDELPEGAHEYRQAWFDFTADKTIKDCINGVTVDGDPGHRVDRAINGKIKGGTHDRDDRKAFQKFVVIKLTEIDSHLSHWKRMTAVQRAEITQALVAACTGDEFKPSHSPKPVKFNLWPEELCAAMREALSLRLRSKK